MLASLLPGLRDVRTPLAVGYLWLVVIWMLLHDYVPLTVDEAPGPLKPLFQLGALVGSTAALAAASFVAYLLGTMLNFAPGSKSGPSRIRYRPIRTRKLLGAALYDSLDSLISWSVGPKLFRQLDTFVSSRLREVERDIGEETANRLHEQILPRAKIDPLGKSFDLTSQPLSVRYVLTIVDDLQAVGIQLQAKNRDYWDTYDRHSAEAQFRAGIAVPIAALVLTFASLRFPLWTVYLAFIVPAYLILLGANQSLLATSSLVQAITLKMVEPPVFVELRELVAREQGRPTNS